MKLEDFQQSLAQSVPTPGLDSKLLALWHAGKNDWQRAHAIVQELDGPEAARIHAYLHRVEGDFDNAAYWYQRAGMTATTQSLESEWRQITRDLLLAP